MKRIVFLVGAVATAALLPLSLYWSFYMAPVQTTGNPPLYFNQKIFYWHVPSATALFVAVAISGVASALYLRKRQPRHDDWALAGGQLAVVFGLIMLVTGSIWAKPAWGHWWVWDARLTSSLILWLTMLGYVLVRRHGGQGSERLAAGLSIFGAINIPLVYLSTTIWRTFHPPKSVVPGLDGEMARAFGLSMLAFALFFALLFATYLSILRASRRLHDAREGALDAGLVE